MLQELVEQRMDEVLNESESILDDLHLAKNLYGAYDGSYGEEAALEPLAVALEEALQCLRRAAALGEALVVSAAGYGPLRREPHSRRN